jgi:hypothetical protein
MENRFAVLSYDDDSNKEQNKEQNKDYIFQKYHRINYTQYNKNIKYENNKKTMLCQNIINSGKCSYGIKCKFAHNLKDQIIEKRQEVYDILNSNEDLSYIDLQKNTNLYRLFLELTKLCNDCNDNKCVGGYNCKQGACNKKYVICYKNLHSNNCDNDKCKNIHLTTRGLKPYRESHEFHNNMKSTILTPDFFNITNKDNINIDNDNDSDLSSIHSTKINTIYDECKQSIFE